MTARAGEAIAVVNAGSSSLKFSLYALAEGPLRPAMRAQVDGLGATPRFVAKDAQGKVCAERSWPAGATVDHALALDCILQLLHDQFAHLPLRGVGHRVVHGGAQFSAPLRVTVDLLPALEAFVPLAPLHQPHNLAPIRRLLASAPQLPQVACFDTAFHRSNPELAQRFALPRALHDEGVRRYGFHGLSYEHIASVLPKLAPRAAAGRTVVLHLGAGASACALQGGRSVASSMGFSALDGLPMGTRSGALDPGVLLYLMDRHGMDARALEKLLYRESGLLGVSGLSSDMRDLLASDAPGAAIAVELFVYRIAREIGSLAAALGGLDAIVFTAGIGEHAPAIRQRIGEACAWLGVHIDAEANAAGGPRISRARSRCSAWVVPTDEELMIATHTLKALGG